MTNHLPAEKGLLNMCLWTAAKSLWHGSDPKLLAETWTRTYRPNIQLTHSLDKVRNMVKDLSSLKSIPQEEKKRLADSIIAQLHQLEEEFKNDSPFSNHFESFVVDVQNILTDQNLYQTSDDACGFFSQIYRGKVTFLEKPLKGKPGSAMAKIYAENRS